MGYGIYYSALAVTAPWWLPNHLLEAGTPIGTARAMRFADYPYANAGKGYLLSPPGWHCRAAANDRALTDAEAAAAEKRCESEGAFAPRLAQTVAAQLGLESGIGVDDGVMRFGVRARVQFPLRLQLDADWSFMREHDRDGVDTVWMGREHLSLRFAESSAIQFYSGVGPQHFCDARGCILGVDFTWGFEAFPGKPWTVAAEGSIGNLDQAFAPGLRGRVGYLIGPVEASVGWHQRWVGDVALGGPFIGVGAWF
jgi:hypothetical protein